MRSPSETCDDSEWVTVKGFDLYEVNRLGQVRRKAQILKPGKIPSGHLTVGLCRGKGKPKSMYVHRLVALAFLEDAPEGKPLVNHKNGNPKDNRLSNLEWVSCSENIMHGWRNNGRRSSAEVHIMAVTLDGEPVASFRSIADAARFLNTTPASIRSAALRKGTSCGYRWVIYEKN